MVTSLVCPLVLQVYPPAIHTECGYPHLKPSCAALHENITVGIGVQAHSTTALLEAAAAANLDRALEALRHGADVHAIDEGGLSALILAARAGSLELVTALLDRGALAQPVEPFQHTP